jgi:hypothetical protein
MPGIGIASSATCSSCLLMAVFLPPEETDYYFVSNQQGIYAEQLGAGDSFLNHGTTEPATVSVYHLGRELAAADCPPITVWEPAAVAIRVPFHLSI